MLLAKMLGTIPSMQRNPFWITICLLVLHVTSSCASSPDLKSAIDPFALPSPTPFQPGAGSLRSSAPTFDSQSIATFTPYPTVVPKNGIDTTPQVSSNGDTPSIIIDPLTGLPPADPESASAPSAGDQGHEFSALYASPIWTDSGGCSL